MEQLVFNTERGHVCPVCEREVLTGFYYVVREVPVLDAVQMPEGYLKPIRTRSVPQRLHPPCVALFDNQTA